MIAVGLRPRDLADAPHLRSLGDGGFVSPLQTVFPAVTCTVQASFLTGLQPRDHGIVGNGWYHRDTSEIRFWLQSNHLVDGPKVYERALEEIPSFTCAKLFWWFNMHSAAALSVTPRPEYHSDGLKLPGLYSKPPELKDQLQSRLGDFPLFRFWGPGADVSSTDWIARSAQLVIEDSDPELTLVYLPHLDYDHQRYGPDDERSRQAVRDLDSSLEKLIQFARGSDREILVLSEYGIEPVDTALYPNRWLREHGYLKVQQTSHGELLDGGASQAFSVCDHQIAHVYVNDPASRTAIYEELKRVDGIEHVLDHSGKMRFGIDHSRSGDLILIAAPGHWFAYPYWLEEAKRPDFATTVDIHRKPGYDPAELFIDPSLRMPKVRMARRLLQKKLGFRYRMDVISTDPQQVRGSHGRLPVEPDLGPVAIGSFPRESDQPIKATEVSGLILERLRR